MQLFLMACGPAVVYLAGLQRSILAWVICASYCAWVGWQWRRQCVAEQRFRDSRRHLETWLENGDLCVGDHRHNEARESLADVVSIDAVEERRGIVRLLVEQQDGRQSTYAGFDDMESFALEFRRNAPHAKYRRVRLAFPMTFKEV